ncbi:hypothetical protein F4X10_08210 [Candidatus Poribacteria bacterium]|nr:hypothetical protein [Candidatus Poribacteria bacterium]
MKNFRFILATLLLFGFSATLMGNEWANYYFPDAPGSYWVYEDQNGDELTRYAIEPEEIDGEFYRAFSYDPALEDWADFEHYVHPYFYQVGADWVAFFVGTEIENALKAATMKQMEEMMVIVRQTLQEQMPEGLNITFDIDYDIEVDSQDHFYFLPTPATFGEEWTAIEINVVLTMTIDFQGLPIEIPGGSAQTVKTYTTLVETGNVTGTETVETDAGTFEDCLVIEYRTDASTETVTSVEVPEQPGSQDQQDVTLTTVWLAPNVGIVKFEHQHESSPENAEFGIEMPQDQTLELINYEIKPSSSEDE